jgi:hypothetical protein
VKCFIDQAAVGVNVEKLAPSSPTIRTNKLERFSALSEARICVHKTTSEDYKTSRIRNLRQMNMFRSKVVSFLLLATNTSAWKNTLAFNRICKL